MVWPLMMTTIGCHAPDARVRIEQPQVSGLQSEATLLSSDVIWNLEEQTQTARLVARFPLPGATVGEENYLLYLRWPDGRRIVPCDLDAHFRAVGFFIQLRGRHAGLTPLAEGYLTVKGSSQGPRATRRLEIDVTCEDGTRLRGELLARRNDWAVARFERRERPADVRNLPPVLPDRPRTAGAIDRND